MKNKKIFNFFKVFINILYVVSVTMIFGYVADKWIELEFIDFFFRLSILILGTYLISFISIIWHELGHLVFGIKSKLKFVSFSVLNLIIKKEDNKFKISKSPTISGVGGYCNMSFEESKEYSKKSIVSYFLGGITFNWIFVIIFSILLTLSNNAYLAIIALLFISTNVYLALYNSVPVTQMSGLITDMLHVINCYKDSDYVVELSKIDKIQNLVSNGCELKDIDEKLFYMPKDFSTSSKITMAQLYIDYIADKGQYYDAIEHIKTILKNTENKLAKANINLFKINLIYYAFKGNCDTKIISEYWNKDIRNYLDAMGGFEPQFIGINYMYSSLIEKDKKKAQSYLNKFEQIKKNHHNKNSVKETEKTILAVKEKINAVNEV